jgi:hypothetical protein
MKTSIYGSMTQSDVSQFKSLYCTKVKNGATHIFSKNPAYYDCFTSAKIQIVSCNDGQVIDEKIIYGQN